MERSVQKCVNKNNNSSEIKEYGGNSIIIGESSLSKKNQVTNWDNLFF